MKNKLVLLIAIFFTNLSYSQVKKLTWDDMAKVDFEKTFLEQYGDYFLIPEFKESVIKLEGQTIQIKGYVLNLIEDGKTFLLSKQPMASCFFCGMAGPETIIELQFEEKQDLKTDQVIRVQGVLQLNKDDVNHCNYILRDLTIID